MIEVSYYYDSQGTWKWCSNNFQDVNKAMRFIWMVIKNPKMVFMELHCDDPYDEEYLRRKCKL